MFIKLNNNHKLKGFIAGSIAGSIAVNVDKLFIKDCPLVNGYDNLNKIYYVQSDNGSVILSRVRVDIGNVSGSISKLMKYASMAGFNDAGEEQSKPRLVGTWTINDWYTSAQLAQAQAAFDGLTIVGDPNYILDFSQMAVQVLDPNEDNYNPAVAIILQGQNKGVTMSNAPFGYGRWFITQTEAALTSVSTYFTSKNSVTDSNLIVSEDALSYYFREFNEFRFFNNIGNQGFYGSGISSIIINERLTTIGNLAFGDCGNLKYVYIPSNVTSILNKAFRSNKANGIKRINCTIPPSIVIENTITPNTTKIIVGVGNYYTDKDVVEKFLSTAWSAYSSQIQSCYDYYAPQISYVDDYITITTQENSTIYYTTDGSTPTEQSTQYNSPFEWDGIGVIKAVSKYDRIMDNIIQSLPFYAQTCDNPTFIIDSINNQVAISCATSGAVIHYTTDGSCPTLDSPIYSGPITFQEDIVKVRCFATATGYNDSETVSKICVLNESLWGTDGDTSSFAVQCMDSTKPNYNPAVCIILNDNNKLTDKVNGGGGYITKIDAATIPNIGTSWQNGWFINKGTVVDSSHIMDGGSYDFEEFTEFQYFTSVTSIPDCANAPQMQYCAFSCNKLKTIVLPSTLTYIGTGAFKCPLEGDIVIPSGVTRLTERCFYATRVNVIVHDLITVFAYDCFGSNATIDRFPSNLTTLNRPNKYKIYTNDYTLPATCINMTYGREWRGSPLLNNCVHWLAPALTSASYTDINDFWHFAGVSKVYVGTGEDKDADDAVLAEYQSHLTKVANKFDTWYNYLHPTT